MTESFWSIPKQEKMRTPLSILKEQAAALTEVTEGTLQCQVIALQQGELLTLQMYIVVPALANYKFHVLSYTQPIYLYPGQVITPILNQNINVANEAQFIENLKRILSSSQMQRVIAGLIAQATEKQGS